MDPGIVDSSSFGQLWKVAFNFQEQVGNYIIFIYRSRHAKFSTSCMTDKQVKQPENTKNTLYFAQQFIIGHCICDVLSGHGVTLNTKHEQFC